MHYYTIMVRALTAISTLQSVKLTEAFAVLHAQTKTTKQNIVLPVTSAASEILLSPLLKTLIYADVDESYFIAVELQKL